MEVIHVDDYQALSEVAAIMMVDEVKNNVHPNIALATGGSPELAYRLFTQKILNEDIDMSHVRFTKLDEWCNLDPTHEATCEKYIQDLVIKPLNIAASNYISFASNATDFKEEVLKIQHELKEYPISLCILGLGKNGHLGLNEPHDYLHVDAHVAPLDTLTKTHAMIQDVQVEAGMTIGMADIFASNKILLLVSGKGKEAIVKELFTKKITSHLPASYLWLHPNTTVLFQNDLYQL